MESKPMVDPTVQGPADSPYEKTTRKIEKKYNIDRRSFLKRASIGAAAGAGVMATVSYPGKPTHAAAKFRWKLQTSFGPTAPVISEYCQNMAADLKVMSQGKMDIKVFGGGELVPAFGVHDAVKLGGAIEMYVSATHSSQLKPI